jgi:hypothetical protein
MDRKASGNAALELAVFGLVAGSGLGGYELRLARASARDGEARIFIPIEIG